MTPVVQQSLLGARILVASGARALALFSPSCCAVVALPLADVKSTRMDAPQRCEVPPGVFGPPIKTKPREV